jgi:hypothetical protein
MIGIDPYQRLYYEGSGHTGFAIWPSPVITIATLIQSEVDNSSVPGVGSQNLWTPEALRFSKPFPPLG